MDVKDIFLAVLDGPAPADWKPWDMNGDKKRLQEAREEFGKVKVKIPDYFKYRTQYRLSIMLHSSEVLHDLNRKDDDWKRYVGVIVDASCTSDQERVKDSYYFLLAKLRSLKEPWLKYLGFYLLAITPDETTDQVSFFYELKNAAKDQLDFCTVKASYVSSCAGFILMLKSYSSDLIGLDLPVDLK